MTLGFLGVFGLLALISLHVQVPTMHARVDGAGEETSTPGLVIARIDRLPVGGGLRERLWLLNPSPLYIPLTDDAGPSGLSERPGGTAAEMFPPTYMYPERRPGAALLAPAIPATAGDAATNLALPRWFVGMTRSGTVGERSPPSGVRAARISLYGQGATRAEAEFDLVTDSVLGTVMWRPVELTVVINAVGAVSRPAMVASSGEDRADERIRDVVGRDFLSKLSLRPGIYRIEVGP